MPWGRCCKPLDGVVPVNFLSPLVYLHVKPFKGTQFKILCRLDGSENSITEALTNPRKSCFGYVSRLRKHWRDSLFLISCHGFIIVMLFYVTVSCVFCCFRCILYFVFCGHNEESEIKFELNWIKFSPALSSNQLKVKKKIEIIVNKWLIIIVE